MLELPWTDIKITLIGVGTFLIGVGTALSGVAAYIAVRKRRNGNGEK